MSFGADLRGNMVSNVSALVSLKMKYLNHDSEGRGDAVTVSASRGLHLLENNEPTAIKLEG